MRLQTCPACGSQEADLLSHYREANNPHLHVAVSAEGSASVGTPIIIVIRRHRDTDPAPIRSTPPPKSGTCKGAKKLQLWREQRKLHVLLWIG